MGSDKPAVHVDPESSMPTVALSMLRRLSIDHFQGLANHNLTKSSERSWPGDAQL
jgi:hypothetical protein